MFLPTELPRGSRRGAREKERRNRLLLSHKGEGGDSFKQQYEFRAPNVEPSREWGGKKTKGTRKLANAIEEKTV